MAYTSMVNIRRVQQIHIGLKQVILALVADYHYATCKPSLPNIRGIKRNVHNTRMP